MKYLGRAVMAASIVALGAATAPQASAQNLFEMLFGGGIKRQRGDFLPAP